MYGGAQYVPGPYGTAPGQRDRESIRTDLVKKWHNYWNPDDSWAHRDTSKQPEMYTDPSRVRDYINGESGRWSGSGHELDGGYDDAFEKCFQHIELALML